MVIDIRMPPTFTDEGARAARELKRLHPDLGVLVLSQHIETTLTIDLISLAGFGYLLKDRVLDLSERTVEAHVRHLLTKLNMPDSEDDHRRVQAVLAHLSATQP